MGIALAAAGGIIFFLSVAIASLVTLSWSSDLPPSLKSSSSSSSFCKYYPSQSNSSRPSSNETAFWSLCFTPSSSIINLNSCLRLSEPFFHQLIPKLFQMSTDKGYSFWWQIIFTTIYGVRNPESSEMVNYINFQGIKTLC